MSSKAELSSHLHLVPAEELFFRQLRRFNVSAVQFFVTLCKT